MKRLSVGDALAVLFLLLFIFGWLAAVAALCWWRIDTGSLPENADDWSVGEGVWSLILAGMPPMWAARVVTAIAVGGDE